MKRFDLEYKLKGLKESLRWLERFKNFNHNQNKVVGNITGAVIFGNVLSGLDNIEVDEGIMYQIYLLNRKNIKEKIEKYEKELEKYISENPSYSYKCE